MADTGMREKRFGIEISLFTIPSLPYCDKKQQRQESQKNFSLFTHSLTQPVGLYAFVQVSRVTPSAKWILLAFCPIHQSNTTDKHATRAVRIYLHEWVKRGKSKFELSKSAGFFTFNFLPSCLLAVCTYMQSRASWINGRQLEKSKKSCCCMDWLGRSAFKLFIQWYFLLKPTPRPTRF